MEEETQRRQVSQSFACVPPLHFTVLPPSPRPLPFINPGNRRSAVDTWPSKRGAYGTALQTSGHLWPALHPSIFGVQVNFPPCCNIVPLLLPLPCRRLHYSASPRGKNLWHSFFPLFLIFPLVVSRRGAVGAGHIRCHPEKG